MRAEVEGNLPRHLPRYDRLNAAHVPAGPENCRGHSFLERAKKIPPSHRVRCAGSPGAELHSGRREHFCLRDRGSLEQRRQCGQTSVQRHHAAQVHSQKFEGGDQQLEHRD